MPTASDDVFFASSSTGTCTISGTRVCKSLDTTGHTGTFAAGASTPILNIGTTTTGGLTIGSGTTWNYTGQINIISTSTHTITTNGKTLNQLTVNGAGVSATLGSALTVTNALTITQGTFSTSGSNFAVSCGSLISSGSSTRTITLNGSTITLSGEGTVLDFTTQTNLTFTAGTSTVETTGGPSTAVDFKGNTRTFYNLAINGGSQCNVNSAIAVSNNLALYGTANLTISGAMTYAALLATLWTGAISIVSGSGSYAFKAYSADLSGGNLIIYNPAAGAVLQDNLTITGLVAYGGDINTNGKTVNVTSMGLVSIDASNRSFTLGASQINAFVFSVDASGGGTSTISPGTSTVSLITDGGELASQDGTGFTFYRLVVGAVDVGSGGVELYCPVGALNITVTDYMSMVGSVDYPPSIGLTAVNITGNLHLGGSPTGIFYGGGTPGGVKMPFNVTGSITTGNCTIYDIDATGSTTPWNFAASSATIVDGGDNAGITFPTGGGATVNAILFAGD